MRRRLLLLAFAALLPLLVLAAVTSLLWLRQTQRAMRDEAVTRAEEILNSVEREIFAQAALLRVLGESPSLDSKSLDLPRFHDIAMRHADELPLWDRVILIDSQGRQLVNTAFPYGAALPGLADPASFHEVLARRTPLVGNMAASGNGPPRASLRVPVMRDGELRYVLTAVLDPGLMRDLVDLPHLPKIWRPFVVDGNGLLVAAPRLPERVGQRPSDAALAAPKPARSGTYDGMTLTGAPTVTAFARSPRTNWSAHVAIPLDVHRAPLVRALAILSIAGLLAALVTGALVLLIRRELASTRQQEKYRERVARMDALGRMTGGVAHDFNNLLMVVLGNAEMLKRRLQAPELERHVTAIRKAAEKGSHLTRELLAFSRGGRDRAELHDLNDCVRAMLDMLRQSLRGDVTITLDLASGSMPVRIDPIQLDLALLNIAINARDAMPAGGTLSIRTRETGFPDGSGRRGFALALADTGSGVPDEVLPHVFEPFFTTKEAGKGTGLGLSQVYGFAQAAGGLADIESRVGRGTVVTLYLPEARAEAAAVVARPERVKLDFKLDSPLQVLLVDDNEDVRSVTADYLQDAGFEVRQAGNAAEAIGSLASRRPGVLVTDLVMPGDMDGLGLAKEARRRWPHLPVLLISGYSASADEARRRGFTVMAKPFQMHDLAQAIVAMSEQPETVRSA